MKRILCWLIIMCLFFPTSAGAWDSSLLFLTEPLALEVLCDRINSAFATLNIGPDVIQNTILSFPGGNVINVENNDVSFNVIDNNDSGNVGSISYSCPLANYSCSKDYFIALLSAFIKDGTTEERCSKAKLYLLNASNKCNSVSDKRLVRLVKEEYYMLSYATDLNGSIALVLGDKSNLSIAYELE